METQYWIIPTFHYSNCEAELSSKLLRNRRKAAAFQITPADGS